MFIIRAESDAPNHFIDESSRNRRRLLKVLIPAAIVLTIVYAAINLWELRWSDPNFMPKDIEAMLTEAVQISGEERALAESGIINRLFDEIQANDDYESSEAYKEFFEEFVRLVNQALGSDISEDRIQKGLWIGEYYIEFYHFNNNIQYSWIVVRNGSFGKHAETRKNGRVFSISFDGTDLRKTNHPEYPER